MYYNILHLFHISAVWSHQQQETAQVSLSKSKSPLLEKREMRIAFLAENTAPIFTSNVESNTNTHTHTHTHKNRFKGTPLFLAWGAVETADASFTHWGHSAYRTGREWPWPADCRWIIWKGLTCFNTSSQGEVFYLATTLTHVPAIDAAN